MFFKYYSKTINKFYKHISQNIIDYHNSYFRALKKIAKTYHQGVEKTQEKDDTLIASGHDICSYTTRYDMADFQFQAIIKFDGRLDMEKLKKAVRLSVDAEPVLGCIFIEAEPPYWKRIDNIDDMPYCSLEECDIPDEAVVRFLQSPLDIDNNLNVNVKIIRSQQSDTLGIKINPSCVDGTGVKEYIKLLSNIYSCIDNEGGIFVPEPQIVNREDEYRLLNELGIKCPELRWNPLLDTPKTRWSFPWQQKGKNTVDYAFCRLSKGSFEKLIRYAIQYSNSQLFTPHSICSIMSFTVIKVLISSDFISLPKTLSNIAIVEITAIESHSLILLSSAFSSSVSFSISSNSSSRLSFSLIVISYSPFNNKVLLHNSKLCS